MPTLFYYEDMVPQAKIVGPSVVVDKMEMVEFAKIWDPVPIHVDEAAGEAAFGGLTAPGVYILCLKQRLLHHMDQIAAVIASLGYDEVRFHKPVRPGDELTLVVEWLEKRLSSSKNDRGIVVHRLSLVNQHDAAVMSHIDTILVRLRDVPA